jgi:hypothetical protein
MRSTSNNTNTQKTVGKTDRGSPTVKKTTQGYAKHQPKRHSGSANTSSKFEGTTEGVLGLIYNCRYSQADLYANVGKQLKGGYDVEKAMEKLQDNLLALPDPLPEDASSVAKLVFDKEITE